MKTEFQAIGLFDDLILTVGATGFTIEGPESEGLDAQDRSNTVAKTLRLMREVATLPEFSIHLVKRIPHQAGLGGGSSDAAGLLRGLRKLLPSTLPQRDFDMVARGVGADVSFFLVGGRALGEGYGEILTPLEDGPGEWLVVVLPQDRCSTASMYRELDNYRAKGGEEPAERNSFHLVAPQSCLEAMKALQDLELREPTLAGSGSAVFATARDEDHAIIAEQEMKGLGYQTWIAKTLSRAESLAIDNLSQ